MKVVTEKNLYIAEKAEKKFKRIKLDFDKFLYFRHLETLHSSSFLTVSIFLGLLQDQEMYGTGISNPYLPPQFTLSPTISASMKQSKRVTNNMFLHVILEYAQQSILHKSLHKQRSNSKAISNVETFGLPTFKHTKIYTIFKASYWINGY